MKLLLIVQFDKVRTVGKKVLRKYQGPNKYAKKNISVDNEICDWCPIFSYDMTLNIKLSTEEAVHTNKNTHARKHMHRILRETRRCFFLTCERIIWNEELPSK